MAKTKMARLINMVIKRKIWRIFTSIGKDPKFGIGMSNLDNAIDILYISCIK